MNTFPPYKNTDNPPWPDVTQRKTQNTKQSNKQTNKQNTTEYALCRLRCIYTCKHVPLEASSYKPGQPDHAHTTLQWCLIYMVIACFLLFVITLVLDL